MPENNDFYLGERAPSPGNEKKTSGVENKELNLSIDSSLFDGVEKPFTKSYEKGKDKIDNEILASGIGVAQNTRRELSLAFVGREQNDFNIHNGGNIPDVQKDLLTNPNIITEKDYDDFIDKRKELESEFQALVEQRDRELIEHINGIGTILGRNEILNRYLPLLVEYSEHIQFITEIIDASIPVNFEQIVIRYAVNTYETKEEFLLDHPGEEYIYSEHDPVLRLGEIYKNRTEEQKILLLRTLGDYMGKHYNDDLRKNSMTENVSSQEIWDSMKDQGDGGICGSIHKEMAKLANTLGIVADIATVNTGESAHLIMRGLKEDGKYFIIDYSGYIEADSEDELLDYYHVSQGKFTSFTITGDENGKFKSLIQTDFQKRNEENSYTIPDLENRFIGEEEKVGTYASLNNQGELNLEYNSTIGEHSTQLFYRRIKDYGKIFDFTGVRYDFKGEKLQLSGQLAHTQSTLAISSYALYRNKTSDNTHTTGWAEIRGAFNTDGIKVNKIGEGFIKMGELREWEDRDFKMSLGTEVIAIPKDLSGNFHNFTVIPSVIGGVGYQKDGLDLNIKGKKNSYNDQISIGIGQDKKKYNLNGEITYQKEKRLAGVEERIRLKLGIEIKGSDSSLNLTFDHDTGSNNSNVGATYKKSF